MKLIVKEKKTIKPDPLLAPIERYVDFWLLMATPRDYSRMICNISSVFVVQRDTQHSNSNYRQMMLIRWSQELLVQPINYSDIGWNVHDLENHY